MFRVKNREKKPQRIFELQIHTGIANFSRAGKEFRVCVVLYEVH